jgi:L-seryl-tRNA(Ser) seleniumtransferase
MTSNTLRRLPSVDNILKTDAAVSAVERYGRPAVVVAVRHVLDAARITVGNGEAPVDAAGAAEAAVAALVAGHQPNVRAVFNLTGTVLHTNLGRAILAEAAIEAATRAMRQAVALEFDLETGKRGERDALVRGLLRELTGAEDATVVNNNAAAVLIVLNTLAKGREAIVSRGELIEIGGAFRMPDIMARAGAKLIEVGTTNRTHFRDYAAAVNAKTGLMLKVHTSNYKIEGFTAEVPARELAPLAREHGVPLVNDLGSGTLIDLTRYGLAHEPTVVEAITEGADLVTFSGDKLLGGPQVGFIVGRRELIAKINRNPMKRAMRVDKIRLAAIEATLRLYRDPDRLAERLPTLRHLARTEADIRVQAQRLASAMAVAVGPDFSVAVVACTSQIGSGALPCETISSAGLSITPKNPRGSGGALSALATAFRKLGVPVIGRIEDQALVFDLRCLDPHNERGFIANLSGLRTEIGA